MVLECAISFISLQRIEKGKLKASLIRDRALSTNKENMILQ